MLLPFFTDPYQNELLYSAIGRYHFYSGNISFKETLVELFDNRIVVPSIGFGSNLECLVQKLGNNYSVEKLVFENTIFPFFAPFITKEKQKKVYEDMNGNGRGLYGRLGIGSSKVGVKSEVFFCSDCVKDDIKIYGEPYVHREHQLPAINYCPHHEKILLKYPIDYKTYSRQGYIRFDKRKMDTFVPEDIEVESNEFKDIQVKLSKMAFKLLSIPIGSITLEGVFKRYRTLLRQHNWIVNNTAVKSKALLKAFNAKFPKGFLEKFNSYSNDNQVNTWLQAITTNPNRQGVHPFRHLLLLYFFDQDIDTFLKLKEDVGPFGNGPWPCLNIAAKHYKELVVTELEIGKRRNTGILVGKFKCSCGFIYTRTGPEKDESEKWIKDRINAYGEEWEAKFDELLNMNLSSEEISKRMQIGEATVRYKLSIKDNSMERTQSYRKILLSWKEENPHYGRGEFRSSFYKISIYLYHNDREWFEANLPMKRDNLLISHEDRIKKYRSLILEEIRVNPEASRSYLWKKYDGACKYLFDNDLEWYNINFPEVITYIPKTSYVDWESRDIEYYNEIKKIYPELLKAEKPIRITRGLFSKRLNIFILSTKNEMDKLPKTDALLNEITETIREFQVRRCCLKIDEMLEGEGKVRFEKLREACAVNTRDFKIIKPILIEYIEKKESKKY
ncbi:TnsD family Tn7-like transposition protein [Peribacillus asahii]|uniref:TnsD family Tn7-like transposition protein n=1 Tax=Peribacillus asahii TaxID=228899 RepID=UPI00207A80E2|nr:TnsD family Tn7-like transposition protein [Peribacillus asahii]USK62281.1 TnsD family transposase [Peribacillus asahii]